MSDRDLIERLRTRRLLSQRNQCALQNEAADRLQALSAEVERLKEALTGLTPENLKAIPEWMDDFHILPLDVTAGELRRAFQALNQEKNNG